LTVRPVIFENSPILSTTTSDRRFGMLGLRNKQQSTASGKGRVNWQFRSFSPTSKLRHFVFGQPAVSLGTAAGLVGRQLLLRSLQTHVAAVCWQDSWAFRALFCHFLTESWHAPNARNIMTYARFSQPADRNRRADPSIFAKFAEYISLPQPL
jgi:hypothetical protein